MSDPRGQHQPSIFISYRRDDAQANVGRLFDWLTRQFGANSVQFEDVFVDTDGIAPGDDFEQVLQQRLASANVIIVVIGPRWLDIAGANGRRLDQPGDYVRMEVATALASNKRLIPVLVGGADMPDRDQLPEPLRALATRNAIEINDALHSFERDFDRLVDTILQRDRSRLETELNRLRLFVKALKLSSLTVPTVAVLVLLAMWVGLLEFTKLDLKASSYLQWAGNYLSPAEPEPGVVIVTVDPANLRRLEHEEPEDAEQDPDGHAAWLSDITEWRRESARLIERIAGVGAAAIVFDVLFEPETDADRDVAAASRHAAENLTRVVFGARELDSNGEPVMSPVLRAELEHGGLAWGSVCINSKAGLSFLTELAVLNREDLKKNRQRARFPALALAALPYDPHGRIEVDIEGREISLEGLKGNLTPRFSLVSHLPKVPDDDADQKKADEEGCLIPRPGDNAASLIIRFADLNYWQDRSRLLEMAELMTDDETAASLEGKIVVIGAHSKKDHYPIQIGWTPDHVYGVELHANAIANLLQGRELKRPTLGTNLVIVLTLAAAGALYGYTSATWSLWRRRLGLAALTAAYVSVAVWLSSVGWLLAIVYHASGFAVLYVTLRRLRERSFTATEQTLV